MKDLVRTTVRLDPSALELGFGTRCAAGVAIPLLAAYLAGAPLAGVSAAMGALASGFASRQGVYRTRAASMLMTSGAMAFSALVGALAERSPLAQIVLVALWGAGFGFVGSLGLAATTAGLNAVVALLIFSHPPYGAASALPQAAFVFLGGTLQTLLLVLIWPLQRFDRERGALAAAYRDLAAYARHLADAKLGSPASQPLTALSATLADPQPFASGWEGAAFPMLLEEAERIRASLAALATLRHVLAKQGACLSAAAIDALAARSAAVLEELASALEDARAPHDLAEVWHEADLQLVTLESGDGSPNAQAAIEDGRAYLGELRSAWRAGQLPVDRSAASPVRPLAPQPFALSALGDALETLRANLSPRSVYAQHALRLGLTLLVAGILARVLGLQRGYWIPLTAAILLRPDFTTTVTRGVARAIGTVAGALVAGALTVVVGPSPMAPLVLGIASVWFAYAVFKANYAIYSLAMTCYIVFLLAFGGAPEHLSAHDRVLATLIGAALAFAAYGIWPTWSRAQVPIALADLLDAQRRYVGLVLGAYREPARADLFEVHAAQLQAWRARSRAEAAIDQMLAEPVPARAVSVRAAVAFLPASRRFGAAALALHSRLGRIAHPFTALLDTLAPELDAALGALAAALRAGKAPDAIPPLRNDQVELKKALDVGPDPDLAALVAETDLLVESVEAMAEALRRRHRASS
jgi:uncharacterized membrane protein YccC